MSDALNPAPAAGPDAQPPADEDTYVATFAGDGPSFDGELADGLYDATVADLVKITGDNPFKKGEKRTQLRWDFTVDGREKDGRLGWFTSFSMHEKSKLPGTLAAVGRSLPTPENPGIGKKAELVGLKCRILVENVPGKKDTSKKFPRITKVLRKA
jgi:hypothetical protein